MNQQLQSQPVYKSNALVEASYRLSPAEQRIILKCITQVRRDQNQPITDEMMYSITAAEYASMVGTESHSVYKELADAALRLKRREVWLTERPNGDGSHEETLITGWVQSIRYRKSEGRVELRFTKDMLPYLTQLSTQFTRYALADVAKMTSAHAIRLYELLAQWRGTGTGQREVPIERLREYFQLGDKYALLYELKRWVIKPAVEQINELSPMWVKWDQRKTGRRVSHLVFTFGEKASEKPQKLRKGKTQGKVGGKAKNGSQDDSGARFGIPEAMIKAKRKPGEGYEDAALRILDEKKRNKEEGND
jgi:plasmid replication initiation protein